MGYGYDVICNECHTKFRVNKGGGFIFHLLHCDTCGKEKRIGFGELGEIHLRYLKGLPGPYCIATFNHDQNIRENYQGTPLTKDEYNLEIEKLVGRCECRGVFTRDAPAKCPNCKSMLFSKDPNGCEHLYD